MVPPMCECVSYPETQDEQQKTPLSFDLNLEWKRALREQEAYREFFYKQAESGASEMFGKVSSSTYHQGIQNREDGTVKLTFFNDELAEDSSQKVIDNPTFPAWYRDRAKYDLSVTHQLQKEIQNILQTGQMQKIFVEFSPAVFEQMNNIEELREKGFSNYSFLRVHQVVSIDGTPRSELKAFIHYLDPQAQEELFTLLTGKNPPQGNLLGFVTPLDTERYPITDIRNKRETKQIDQLIRGLYEATPEERKIRPLEDDPYQTTDELMEEYLKVARPILHNVYTLLMNPNERSERILKEWRTWENTLKNLILGKDILHIKQDLQQLQEFASTVYNFSYAGMMQHLDWYEEKITNFFTSCGGNTGFSDMFDYNPLEQQEPSRIIGLGKTALQNAGYAIEPVDPNDSPCKCGECHKSHFHCPKCSHIIIVGAGTKQCPGCGLKATCK
ncbi:hypothetical protein HGA88_04730 [Candidatus Roizmanbacteria bacterium]|nr:hypothetical protein [Candidatus Roizmanbacteria bacterium]